MYSTRVRCSSSEVLVVDASSHSRRCSWKPDIVSLTVIDVSVSPLRSCSCARASASVCPEDVGAEVCDTFGSSSSWGVLQPAHPTRIRTPAVTIVNLLNTVTGCATLPSRASTPSSHPFRGTWQCHPMRSPVPAVEPSPRDATRHARLRPSEDHRAGFNLDGHSPYRSCSSENGTNTVPGSLSSHPTAFHPNRSSALPSGVPS